MPHATEDIKWGSDLCFCIAGKMFCVAGMEEACKVSFKCSDEEFNALTERDGIVPAPYMAKHKWVMVELPSALSKQEWDDCTSW